MTFLNTVTYSYIQAANGDVGHVLLASGVPMLKLKGHSEYQVLPYYALYQMELSIDIE